MKNRQFFKKFSKIQVLILFLILGLFLISFPLVHWAAPETSSISWKDTFSDATGIIPTQTTVDVVSESVILEDDPDNPGNTYSSGTAIVSSVIQPPSLKNWDTLKATVSLNNPGLTTFIEDFDDTTYKDATNTDADWDTAEEKVKLVFNLDFAAAVNYGVGDRPESVFAADFDNDGYQDLATVNYGDDNVSILFGNGDGTFGVAINYSVGRWPESVFAADLDGDGDQDLAVASYHWTSNISILFNNGDGTFAPVVNYTVGSWLSSVSVSDLDGDGDQDLVVANPPGSQILILFNDGSGTFGNVANYATGLSPYSVTIADLDNDNDNDLAVANAIEGNGEISILLNNGDGTFAAAVSYSAGSLTRGIAVADFDADGDNDLVAVNGLSDNISIFFNNGDGTFVIAVNYSVGDSPAAVFSADFNGDGYQDLATTNNEDDNVSILLGNGDGTFAAAVNYDVGGNPFSVFSADFNSDSDQDLAVANYGSNNVSVLLNDSTYSSPATAQSTNVNSSGGAISSATLTATDTQPANTDIQYYLSNTGNEAWMSQTSGVTENLNAVFFVDENNGWVVGGNRKFTYTTDGGATWTTPPGRITTDDLNSVYFTDSNTGWAVGNTGLIIYTTDGGVISTTQTSGTVENLNSVYFTDSNTGWAVGDSGTIINTTNGGTLWAAQTSGTTENLNSVYFTDSNTGWAVGDNGTIINTTNGGATWTAQTSGISGHLNSVYFIDVNNGWAVGDGGATIWTTNGGNVWDKPISQPATNLHSVYFADTNIGWAVGYKIAGRVFYTTSGGENWSEQLSPPNSNSLNSIHFTDSYTGWVVGDSGTILNTKSGGQDPWEAVTSGSAHTFTINSSGTSLYWKADLSTTDTSVTPEIDAVQITYNPVVTSITLDLLDESNTLVPSYNGYTLSEGANEFDISGIDKDTYSKLKMRATLSTLKTNPYNPELDEWEITWEQSARRQIAETPAPNSLILSSSETQLPTDGESVSELEVQVLDQFGNAYISPVSINFEIVSGSGVISPVSVNTIDSVASTNYIAGEEAGEVVIKASYEDINSNEITIELVEPALKLTLSAEIIKSTGEQGIAILAAVSSVTSRLPWWFYLISIVVLLGLFHESKSSKLNVPNRNGDNISNSQSKKLIKLKHQKVHHIYLLSVAVLAILLAFSFANPIFIASTEGFAQPGDTIRYTIGYENVGEIDLSNILITNFIPQGTSFNESSLFINGSISDNASYDSVTEQASFLINELLIGESGDASFDVTISEDAPEEITNIAEATYQPGSITISISLSVLVSPVGGPEPECGNGVVEGGEECDDGNLTDGDGCNSACQVEEEEIICGNNVFETGEQCDGTDLGDVTCQSLGYESGALSCKDDCIFNVSGCVTLAPPPETPPEVPPEAPPGEAPEAPGVSEEETPGTPEVPEIPGVSEEVPPTPPTPSVPLTPTVNVSALLEKTANNIDRAFESTVEFYKKNVLGNKVVQEANRTLVAPTITAVVALNAIAAIPLAVTAYPFVQYILFYLTTLFTEPAYLFTRKRKEWGTIYDSLTKQPIPLAVVRLYDVQTNKLLSTRVTSQDGRYYFLIDKDKQYYLTVKAPEYNFPSKYLGQTRADGTYDDIYYGERVYSPKLERPTQEIAKVVEQDEGLVLPRPFVNLNIPLDPQPGKVMLTGFSKRVETKITNLSQYLISSKDERLREYKNIVRQARERRLSKYVAYAGPTLTLICLVISPSLYLLTLLAIHLILLYLFKFLAQKPGPSPWGYVYEKKTDKRLPKTIMRLFDTKFGKLLLTQVSISEGRYGFSVGNDRYVLTCEKEGYILPEEKIEVQGRKDGMVRKEIGLEREGVVDL